MTTYYDQWLQSAAGQQAKQAAIDDPASYGYTQMGRNDQWGNPTTGWAKVGGTQDTPTVDGWIEDYRPSNPYTTGLKWNDPNLSFEGASEMGLFGPQDAGLGQSLRNTYSRYGKSDSDVVHAAQQALQQHLGTFGEIYDAASSFGGINDQIAQNLGVDLNGFDFKSIPGFSDAAAEARGNADKVRNSGGGGTFGQGNLFSDFATYEQNRFGDVGHAYNQDPERVLLGINTPAESALWSEVTGKKYDPTIDMYGGATNKQQQAMVQNGLDPSTGQFVQRGIEAAAGGVAGGYGYGNYAAAVGQGNSLQNGGINTDNAIAALPALTSAGSSYLGSGNIDAGSYDTPTLTGNAGNDTLTNNTGYTSGSNNTMFDDYGNPLDMSNMGDMGADPYGLGVDQYGNSTGQFANYGDPNVSYADQGDPGSFGNDSSGMYDQAKALAAKFGITPASALKYLAGALGRGAPAALGAIGANKQANSLQALNGQYMAMGAPSRARYEASFDPNFTMMNDPGYADALAAASKASLHSLSMQGNPAGSPNAWAQTLSDVNSKFAYPALTQYRNQNAATGGIATFNAAAPGTAAGAIDARGNVLNAVGAGINDIFNPRPSLAQILAQYGKAA